MIDMMTIALFVLALISLLVGATAIGWLSIISKHLSVLGKRVLESEEIGRVIQAAEKTESFESLLAGCQSKVEENLNQLTEHHTKLSELTAKQGAAEQMLERYTADLANASEKKASFELRYDEFENNVGEKLNQLQELQTKLNELAAQLESTEEMMNHNGTGLAQADQSIKALTDKIESFEKFQTTTEKTHSLLQAAFTDSLASMLPEESLGITPEDVKLEEAPQEPEDWQEEAEDQKTPETYRFDLG